jgi:simple sugar transport system substrate-binding protein/ribose transport system substrate-binding protein
MFLVHRRTLVGSILAAAVAGSLGRPTAAASDRKDIIGVSIPTLDNPFWVRAVRLVKYVTTELNIDLVVVAAANQEQKQLRDVRSLLSRGVDALVVAPQSTANASGLIQLANRAHKPIMIVDRYPGFPAENEQEPYLGFIGPDDVRAGDSIASFLIHHGASKLVGIGGTPGSSVAEGRQKGLMQALAAAGSKATLVQYVGAGETETDGYAAMQKLLSAHPAGTIDGVWCYNDALCLGAFRAVRQSGRSDQIILGGMDLIPQALDLIAKKTDYVYSTGGHWLQLGSGVVIAFDKLHGHDPLQRDIRQPLLDLDSETIEKFKSEYIDNPLPFNVKDYTLTYNPGAKTQFFPLVLQ